MTNTELITEFNLRWAGKSALEIASDVDVIFGGLIPLIPAVEHLAISSELANIGILTNYDVNDTTTAVGICKRKKAPLI